LIGVKEKINDCDVTGIMSPLSIIHPIVLKTHCFAWPLRTTAARRGSKVGIHHRIVR